jgi:hypothetical protein
MKLPEWLKKLKEQLIRNYHIAKQLYFRIKNNPDRSGLFFKIKNPSDLSLTKITFGVGGKGKKKQEKLRWYHNSTAVGRRHDILCHR